MNQRSDEPDSSEELERTLQAAKAGSAEARNELFEQIQTYLNFVAQQIQNPHLNAKAGTSDIVQQTLLQAAEEFESFRGDTTAQFRGWIRQILINETRTIGRRFASQRRNTQIELSLVSPDSNEHPRDPTDDQLTPCSDAMAREQAERINQCVEKLPDELRQVIRMRNWEKLQFNEIGEKMGISTSNAWKLWYRALVELQRLHAEE